MTTKKNNAIARVINSLGVMPVTVLTIAPVAIVLGLLQYATGRGLGYQDVRHMSPTSQVPTGNISSIDPYVLVLTDYRATHLRYFTGGKVCSPHANNCLVWSSALARGVLFIGAAVLPVLTIDCLKPPSQWRLQCPTGRAALPMHAD